MTTPENNNCDEISIANSNFDARCVISHASAGFIGGALGAAIVNRSIEAVTDLDFSELQMILGPAIGISALQGFNAWRQNRDNA